MGSKERKAREKDQRRKTILDATRNLLLKKGIANISIRKIAELAELGLGTIYSYFSSKEEIFAALSEEVFDLVYEKLFEAASSAGGPPERIRAIARAFMDFNKNHTSYYDFLDFFISTPQIIFPPEIKSRIDRNGDRLLGPVIAAIEDGIRQKKFNCPDPRKKALIFTGTLHGLMHFKKMRNTLLKSGELEELFDAAVESFILSLSHKAD